MLTIKMYPARNGDSFLVTEDDASAAVMIDGGYAETVREHAISDLRRLAEVGRSLDLVVATHVDADHISGLLHFFGTNGAAANPHIIPVAEVWHNSLRSLQGLFTGVAPSNTTVDLGDADQEILLSIRRRGYPQPSAHTRNPAEISARQGSSLAALLLGNGYRWNGGAGEVPILASPTGIRRELIAGTNFMVLSPSADRLRDLGEWWVRELRRMGITGAIAGGQPFDDAFEFLSASDEVRSTAGSRQISASSRRVDAELGETYIPDASPTNGSSISFILQSDQYLVLFLADAWSEDIITALRGAVQAGALLADRPLIFDAIKLSHHGSRRNTSPELLGLIDSPRYLISSSGERHDHPDVEVLKAIVDRPARFARDLYFNYRTPGSVEMQTYVSRTGSVFKVHEGVHEIIIR